MELVIAILLGLILVAMVSSNPSAANGVFKVIRYAFWFSVFLLCWGAVIGQSVWYTQTYFPEQKWGNIIGIAFVAILPPLLIWLSRTDIVKAYKANKWAAIRFGIKQAAWLEGGFAIAVFYNEFKGDYQYLGWMMILVPLAFFFMILVYRSATQKVPFWYLVLPPDPPDPSDRINQEWRIAKDALEAEWQHLEAMREKLPFDEYEAKERAHYERVAENSAKQKALEESILSEWRAEQQAVRQTANQSSGFVFFAIFAFIGSVMAVWDIALAYSAELAGSKQWKAWLYASLMTLAYAGSISAILSALIKRK